MSYWRAYGYAFDHPRWALNLLCGAVCVLIPVAGQMVYTGWLFEVIEGFHRRGHQKYAAFEFGRFADYLMRGVWPVLVQLILGLLVVPVVFICMAIFFLIMFSTKGKPDPILLAAMIVGLVLFSLGLSVIMNLVKTPMVLRAGFTGELKSAFSWSATMDFIRKMWLEILVVGLFMIATSIPIILLGELCCIIGVYPAAALLMMAEHHLLWQLYELYLKRGGVAITLRPETPLVVTPAPEDLESV
jgi:hypothetical protein